MHFDQTLRSLGVVFYILCNNNNNDDDDDDDDDDNSYLYIAHFLYRIIKCALQRFVGDFARLLI